jgi:hypothetical protein
MSHITEAVIWTDIAGAEALTAIGSPLPFDTAREQRFGELEVTDAAGGSKWFCSGVYAAAFNYVAGEDLESWFKSLPWRSGDRAHLLWQTEGQSEGQVSVGEPHRLEGWPA